MEKYSSFRDPGTGIQPFLTLVPPPGNEWIVAFTIPFCYVLGVIRTSCVLTLALLYLALVRGVCVLLFPIPFLHRTVTGALTSVLARLILLFVGVIWLRVENVTRRRGKSSKITETWHPRAGDIIVSNWVSWLEILWLAFRFDPIFVLPVSQNVISSPKVVAKNKTGRQTGTGSADVSSPNKMPRTKIPIVGFRQVSLLSAILFTGRVPPNLVGQTSDTLEIIQKKADRPIVVFPECTTSNGRGLLRFAHVFRDFDVPVKHCNIFVMCVRFDPPTTLSPTTTHTIPSGLLNPLLHLYRLTTALQPLSVSIRLLAPSESPSSRIFITNEVIPGYVGDDRLSEICATLIAQIGRLKRTGMCWEDKAELLNLLQSKHS